MKITESQLKIVVKKLLSEQSARKRHITVSDDFNSRTRLEVTEKQFAAIKAGIPGGNGRSTDADDTVPGMATRISWSKTLRNFFDWQLVEAMEGLGFVHSDASDDHHPAGNWTKSKHTWVDSSGNSWSFARFSGNRTTYETVLTFAEPVMATRKHKGNQ